MPQLMVAVFAIFLCLVPVYGQNIPDDRRPTSVISLDKEVALGRQLAAETERSSRLVTDPTINEYVNRIAQRQVQIRSRGLFR